MKELGLVLGVLALAVVAIVAVRYSEDKQAGVYPAGFNNPAVREREPHQSPWPATAQANNNSAPVSQGRSGTMPAMGTSADSGGMAAVQGCVTGEARGFSLTRHDGDSRYQLQGETAGLQAGAGRWVELGGYVQNAMPQSQSSQSEDEGQPDPVFVVQEVRRIGPGCAAEPSGEVAVPGKTGRDGLRGAPPNLQETGRTPLDAEDAAIATERARRAAEQAAGKGSSVEPGAEPGQQPSGRQGSGASDQR